MLTGTPASGFDASGPAPYLLTEDAFAALPGRLQTVLLDSRLAAAAVRTSSDDSFDRLVTDTAGLLSVREPLAGGGVLVGESPVNALDDVLDDVRAQRAAARSAVAPAVVSLILVALAMILRLLGAAAELRVPELALAALRGVGRRRAWLLGLSEPWLILAVGAPLGAAAGWLAALVLVRSGLRPGIPVPVPAGSIVGALLVVVAIAGVAVLAVWQVQRVSLGSRLAGVRRPGPVLARRPASPSWWWCCWQPRSCSDGCSGTAARSTWATWSCRWWWPSRRACSSPGRRPRSPGGGRDVGPGARSRCSWRHARCRGVPRARC